jgi:hypothetical protein
LCVLFFQERVVSMLQPSLYEDPKSNYLTKTHRPGMPDPHRSLSYCSQPLGYDRQHNAYWLLSAQEATTLFPYQPNGQPTTIGTSGLTGKPSPEPCVLIREPSGWWGYYNTAELPGLLSSFSSEIICERVLILRLIEKLAYTRVQLYRTVLTIRAMQRDWIFRRFRTEHWVQNVKLPSESVSTSQTNRLLEVVWARCAEVRHQLHTSSLYKYEDDPPVITSARAEKENLLKKQKKYRDSITDETFEHHMQRGWSRNDALQKLRQTSASTTATRVIADPTVCPNLMMVLKRSPFLRRNDPPAVQPGQAGAGGADDEDGDGPAVPRIASAPAVAPAAVAPAASAAKEAPVAKPTVAATSPEKQQKVEAADAEVGVEMREDKETAPVSTPAAEEAQATAEVGAAEDVADTAMDVESQNEQKLIAPAASSAGTARKEVGEVAPAEEGDKHSASTGPASGTASAPAKEDSATSQLTGVNQQPSGPGASEDPAASIQMSSISAPIGTVPVQGGAESTSAAAAAVQAIQDGRPLPDLRAAIAATHLSGVEMKSKAIELLHVMTGDLVRIFPSGKDAAGFFNIAQSNISLCLHNTKPDYLGFRWRHYIGRPVNCKCVRCAYSCIRLNPCTYFFTVDAIANLQPSLQICYALQVLKQNKDRYDPEEEAQRVRQLVAAEQRVNPNMYRVSPALADAMVRGYTLPRAPPALPQIGAFGASAPITSLVPGVPGAAGMGAAPLPSAPPRPTTGGYQPYQPPTQIPTQAPRPPGAPVGGYVAPALLPPIVTSNPVVSARMLKLKAELLNMFYLMPEKALRLPELDEAAEKAIADVGNEAANSIRAGLIKISGANKAASSGGEGQEGDGQGQPKTNIDLSAANVERLADKAARKAKRRLRRKLSMEKFLKDVQDATTPQQLLHMVMSLESALPAVLMYKYNKDQLPVTADTLAGAALRLYALDRVIAYDEIKGVENNAVQCPYRLRMQFYPRCVIMGSCNRFIGHTGKCSNVTDAAASRLPEFQDIAGLTRIGQTPYQPTAYRPSMAPTGSNMSATQQQMLANQRRLQYMQQMAALKPKDEDLPLEEILKRLRAVRKELDIEIIAPYMPAKDITAMDWV